ncbi:NAD(P)H-binding protein [Bacillus sp. RG28]|uniref:NAD(P)H-binding protein n=1 Tax=Gottfriedia endophytica TaxID=2820819 RepID=A0A940NH47_9BACI|nr:NAD(P)H-binding protein [Gottfriedia endophytica]MBP0724165.1 NAD(P)H-binding protein [Gottfriedia endophytica]
MNILLLGATGRVGSIILDLLLKTDHCITVLVREPNKLPFQRSNLKIITGDVLNEKTRTNALSGIDGVISSLNTDGNDTLSKTAERIIPLLVSNNIKRIVTIGTAGILNSRVDPAILRYKSAESKRKSQTAAQDHEKAYYLFQKSNLNWTIICPTYLPEGEITKQYRIEEDFLPLNGQSISTGDTAHFTVNEFFNCKHIGKRVGISY